MLILPRVIGHRGAAAHAPENTLASFAKAADLGCAMVEFDVRLTADGVPVVFHDDTLDRCAGVHGAVGRLSLSRLRTVAPQVPTLAEVLELCAGCGLAVDMEIKPDRGMGAATAATAIRVARDCGQAAPLLSSFDADALAVSRDLAPDWPRALLVERVPADWARRVATLGCCALGAHHRALPTPLVGQLKAAGLAVLAFTVNRPGRARRLWSRGVDAVFCDAPDRLL